MLSEWLRPTLPGLTAVFFLAHPDDEFFCLPLISAEVQGGRSVHVVYLTDGGPLASTRERETLQVLSEAGVLRDNVRFAGREEGWSDGGLHRKLGEVRSWLTRYLTERGACARIYVPAWEGGHHDHDACFGVLASLMRDQVTGSAVCLQFPLYTGSGVPGPLFRCMVSLQANGEVLSHRFGAREGARYWSFAAAYPSQWRTWVALGPAAAWGYLVRRSVLVQRVDPTRMKQPPYVGTPYFERRFGVPAGEVLAALRSL